MTNLAENHIYDNEKIVEMACESMEVLRLNFDDEELEENANWTLKLHSPKLKIACTANDMQ